MKIERHGQAQIFTQQEIELLFNEGLQTARDRTLFGVCLYTACRIAEACSLSVADIYTRLGESPPRNQRTQGQHQGQTPNPHHSRNRRLAKPPGSLETQRRQDILMLR
ncbi:hypothetical protein [Microcoleus sp. Pol12A5]|uniref:hypothetical protein n=1 Tax=Microcoleus sp. Pol12A5 TaxID=3055392 RepID=UPI002FD2DE01